MPLSERSKNAKGKAPQKNCQKKKVTKKGWENGGEKQRKKKEG